MMPDTELAGATLDSDNPWPGLDSFREGDKEFFRGRDLEADELQSLLKRRRMTLLFGRSGLGKSSLLQAGLFPRLRTERHLPVYLRVSYLAASMNPRAQVYAAIERAAEAADVEAPEAQPTDSLWAHFHRVDTAYWTRDNLPVTPVLVFDQFEEIFTKGGLMSGAQSERAEEFARELSDLVEERLPLDLEERLTAGTEASESFAFGRHAYRVLIAAREDFLGKIELLRERMPSIATNRMPLGPLSGASAKLVTAAGGALVSRESAEKIIRVVAATNAKSNGVALDRLEVDPALLSLFCRELNERRRNTPGAETITPELVEGNRDSILDEFYHRAVSELAPEVHRLVEDRLLTVDGYRDSIAEANALAMPGVTRDAIDALVMRRVIRREEHEGRSRLELTHDVLTEIVGRSKAARLEREALVAAQQDAERAQLATLAAQRQVRHARMATVGFGFLAAVAVISVVISVSSLQRSRKLALEGKKSLATSELREASLIQETDGMRAVLLAARAAMDDPGNVAARAFVFRSALEISTPVRRVQHDSTVSSALFSPDGQRIVTASSDHTAQVWDAVTGAKLGAPLRHDKDVSSASFSPDGRRIVTSSGDLTAQVWDVATGAKVGPALRHEKWLTSAVFSPDGRRVITASGDHTAQVWNAATGVKIGEPLRHDHEVTSASFSPDGRRIVTSSTTAQVWDAATGAKLGPPLVHENDVNSADFSPDGQSVVTASRDHYAQVWDAATGAKRGPALQHDAWVTTAKFSADGRRIVTASHDHTAQVWDAATGTKLGPPLRLEKEVNSASFSPDGNAIVTSAGDHTAQIWGAVIGARLGPALRHDNSVTAGSFSPDGRHIITASGDHTAQIWNAAPIEKRGPPFHHAGPVTSASYSPDGRSVITSSVGAQVWDVATGAKVGRPLRHETDILSARFSADGLRIVTASLMYAQVWDAVTRRKIGRRIRHRDELNSVSFSPDGRRIVTSSNDSTAQVWDAATGGRLGEPFRHDNAVNGASFSPDGRRVVTSALVYAQVWDAATGAKLGSPLIHDKWVVSANFSPDGRRVVTASRDDKAQVWDAVTGAKLGAPYRHEHWVTSASFSPDGQRILTTSDDRTAQVWSASTGQPDETAKLESLVEAMWRSRIDSNGAVESIPADSTLAAFRRRAATIRNPAPGSFDELLQRVLSARRQ